VKTIGLTGGIGAGKSLVSKVFSILKIPVYNADEAGRRLLDNNSDVIMKVMALFGKNAYQNGHADRAFIASVVFQDSEKLKALNAIIHPEVKVDFKRWFDARKEKHSYCLREAAILFESESNLDCNLVISVSAPLDIRIDRVMKRDQINREQVLARISKQITQEEKDKMSDFVIYNDGERSVIRQVMTMHQSLIS